MAPRAIHTSSKNYSQKGLGKKGKKKVSFPMTNGKSERKRQTGKKEERIEEECKKKRKEKERNDIDSLISRYFEGKCQR